MGHTKFITNRTYMLHKLILLGNVSRAYLRNKMKIGRFIVQKHFLYLKKYIMERLKYIKILINISNKYIINISKSLCASLCEH